METFVSVYLWIFRNLIWINIGLAILLVFFERRNPTSTWLWLMVLTLLPGLGFILYLFLGQDLSKKRMFRLKEIEDISFRERAIKQGHLIEKHRYNYNDFKYKDYEGLIRMHLISADALFTQNNTVELYFDGREKFEALIESIEKAEDYIYLQYYIFKSDRLGKRVIDALCKKAKEGIEVKLLLDGMGGRKVSREDKRRLVESGGEIGVFFPPFVPFISLRINYRNHRKICIIDGKEGYIGGFNIGDEYVTRTRRFGYWRDTHLKISGCSLDSLRWRFSLDWRFATGQEIEKKEIEVSKEKSKDGVGVQIVSSGPDSKWPSIKDGYLKMISNAEEKIYIQTPYFIPDDSIFEALKLAGLSDLDVRVMIPSKPDHPFVYWASMSYIGELLRAGVKFYVYQKGFLHAKVLLMDDFVSSVGTANLDIRSFNLNFEVNAFIYDKDINMEITEKFIEDLKDCGEITLTTYNNRSRIVKIKESVSRLLSPIL